MRPSQERTCGSLAGAARGDCHNRRSEEHLLTPPLTGGAAARRLLKTPLRKGGAAASARGDVGEEEAQMTYFATILIPVFVILDAYAVRELQVGRLVDDDDVNMYVNNDAIVELHVLLIPRWGMKQQVSVTPL